MGTTDIANILLVDQVCPGSHNMGLNHFNAQFNVIALVYLLGACWGYDCATGLLGGATDFSHCDLHGCQFSNVHRLCFAPTLPHTLLQIMG